jgi:Phage integrase family
MLQEFISRAHGKREQGEEEGIPFFVTVHNTSGKFTEVRCGATFWTTVARDITTWLGYPKEDVLRFGSHSFRSTSATAMAENDAPIEHIQGHSNWASQRVVEQRYICQSDRYRAQNAEYILGKENVKRGREEEEEEQGRKRQWSGEANHSAEGSSPGVFFSGGSFTIKFASATNFKFTFNEK